MVTKLGYSAEISTSGFQVLSSASVVDPTGERATVQSSSGDDSINGTGIQKIKIGYINTNKVRATEVVEMNGTNPVNTTATDILLIDSFQAFQVGSGKSAAGTITLKSTDGTKLFAQIDPTFTSFMRALAYVTPDQVSDLRLLDYTLNCPTSPGVIFLLFIEVDNSPDGGGVVIIPQFGFIMSGGDSLAFAMPNPIDMVPSPTNVLRFGVLVKALGGNQKAFSTINII